VLLSVANQAGVPKICLTRPKYGVGAERIDLHAGLGCCCWRRGGPAVLSHGQAYSVLFLLLALLLPPRYTFGWCLAVVAGFYALAKILETFDPAIFGFLGHAVSGHTLKHLAAAYAGYWILVMLQRRRPVLLGIWKERGVDGLKYQEKLRGEWER
jgi:hypothetical protein